MIYLYILIFLTYENKNLLNGENTNLDGEIEGFKFKLKGTRLIKKIMLKQGTWPDTEQILLITFKTDFYYFITRIDFYQLTWKLEGNISSLESAGAWFTNFVVFLCCLFSIMYKREKIVAAGNGELLQQIHFLI